MALGLADLAARDQADLGVGLGLVVQLAAIRVDPADLAAEADILARRVGHPVVEVDILADRPEVEVVFMVAVPAVVGQEGQAAAAVDEAVEGKEKS